MIYLKTISQKTRTSFALALVAVCAAAAGLPVAPAQAQEGAGYWKDSSGQPIRSGFGECVRAGYFSPSMATEQCDPSIAPKKAAAVPAPSQPAAVVAPKVEPKAASLPVVVPTPQSVTYKADSFFDFDKSGLKPEGTAALLRMLEQAKGSNIEEIRVEGHTDAVGSEGYNLKLSIRRAEAVKAFLVKQGVRANIVKTEGFGETQPVANNATGKGRAQNRRVTVELIGSKVDRK
jgi:OmpA-OmpF porin, OOP family